jgi:glycosyltransferase involved in cell wall biosynthesis
VGASFQLAQVSFGKLKTCRHMRNRMRIVHVTASTNFGGPERQMLGLAQSLRPTNESHFLSFAEGGRCDAFLDEVRRAGFEGAGLTSDTPRLARAGHELRERLADLRADIVCCHGYKADLLGWWAGRRLGIPVVAVSRGWTWENRKVRAYEAIDRYMLRWMDCVVCVSEAQARRVRRAGVPRINIRVIRNAIRTDRFETIDPSGRDSLTALFRTPPRRIVGTAGRLSPEKGHDVFIRAAARIAAKHSDVGFVIFGEGALRQALADQIRSAGLEERVVLAGHRADLDRLTPHLDIAVLASYTEGLPNVVLEAMACGVPVVATAVGGTPEVVQDGITGHLVQAGNAEPLAARIESLLESESQRQTMGTSGRARVRQEFTFDAQAHAYQELFAELQTSRGAPRRGIGKLLRRALRRVRVDAPLAHVQEGQ